MAVIESHNAVIGIGQASVWGTAVAATSRLRVMNLQITDSYQVLTGRSHDIGAVSSSMKRGPLSCTGSFQCAMLFGGEWLKLLAMLMGASTASPTEQTTDQDDYLHNIDIAATHSKIGTLAFLTETDDVGEVAGFKLSGCSIALAANAPGTVTFQFTGDKLNLGTTTNTYAALGELTFDQTEEEAILNGANCYARIGNYSTSAALSASDDIYITDLNISLNRPILQQYIIRGANTPLTIEPIANGIVSGNLDFTLTQYTDADYDINAKFLAGTLQMAEIFMDGSQIGTGVNTSIKIQLPYCLPVVQSGMGVPGQFGVMMPKLSCALGEAPAAPAGMSGVTSFMRVAVICKRATAIIT